MRRLLPTIMSLAFCVAMLFMVSGVQAQNLVPNPSFENYNTCPDFVGQFAYADQWVNPNGGSPDLFNTCTNCASFWGADICIPNNIFGDQFPRTGDGHAGLYVYWQGFANLREYLQVQLSQPLVAGTEYELTFYVSLGESVINGIDELGGFVSTTPVNNAGNMTTITGITPQVVANTPVLDQVGWTQITGTFIATGGEQYLTIGNFEDDVNTTLTSTNGTGYHHSYYYVDDVSLIATPLEISGDSVLCAGDSVVLTANQGGAVLWEDLNNPGAVIGTGQNITVFPTVNTSYLAYTATDSATHVVQVTGIAPSISFGNDTMLCVGQQLVLDASQTGVDYLWQDNSTNSMFTVSQTGLYWAQVSNVCGTETDSIQVTYAAPPLIDLGPDTILCTGQTLLLDTSQSPGLQSFLWQDGSSAPDFTVTTAGLYWLQGSNICGTSADSVVVDYAPTPAINLGPDTTLCLGDILSFDVTTTYATYLWQDGSTSPTLTISQTGTYFVQVSNQCGTASDTIAAVYEPIPNINLGPDTILCTGESLTLDATTAGASYLWDDGSTNASQTVSQAGTYFVVATNFCGTSSDSIVIQNLAPPTLDLGTDTLLCEGEVLVLDATNSSSTYLWQDGSSAPTIDANSTIGFYSVTVTNLCGTVSDEITIGFQPAPQVDLGEDLVLCAGESQVYDVTWPLSDYLWQNGSSEPELVLEESGVYWVRLSNECGVATDTLLVLTEECNCSVYVPNAFTPNADGINDFFYPISNCDMEEYQFRILNRWGQVIFESDDPNQSWDGSIKGVNVQVDTYIWQIVYRFKDKGAETKFGHVSVVR